MNTSLFISEKIKVGFQNRSDTYTGKLAYVISMTNKGKLRKEKSFESWRDQNIQAEVFENEPMSGFVLNKKAGGYDTGWNHRKTYVRVYDPRGFEFEITVENLLYILEHTSSIVGKGLEGEFVYSWSGKDLVLLPANAPEYEEIKKTEKTIQETEFLKAKDLTVGETYVTLNKEYLVYLGKFDEYRYEKSWSSKEEHYVAIKRPRKTFHFGKIVKNNNGSISYSIYRLASVSNKFVRTASSVKHGLFLEMLKNLEKEREFSPIDLSASVVEEMDLADFLELFGRTTRATLIAENGKEYTISTLSSDNKPAHFYGEKRTTGYNWQNNYLINTYEGLEHKIEELEDIFKVLKPKVKTYYLENGNVYERKINDFMI